MDKQITKNLIIILLIIINLFLLFIFISNSRQTKYAQNMGVEAIDTIMLQNEIKLNCDIPDKNILPQEVTLKRNYSSELKMVSSIIDNLKTLNKGGNILQYFNDSILAEFRGNGEFLINFHNGDNYDIKNIIKALNLSVNKKELNNIEQSKQSVQINCNYNGYPICNVKQVFNFDDNRLKSISGFKPFDLVSEKDNNIHTFDATTILLSFVNNIQNSELKCTQIDSISAEYYSNSSVSNNIELIPVWCINTDKGIFCYNAHDARYLGAY